MFQCLSAACAHVDVGRSINKILLGSIRYLCLILAVVQYSGLAIAGNAPPVWTVPVNQISSDGYALLGWEPAAGENSKFYKVTETFDEQVSVHYTEA